MKIALTFLAGSLLASSWWAAAIWGHKIESTDLTELWAASVILTILVVAVAVMIALGDRD